MLQYRTTPRWRSNTPSSPLLWLNEPATFVDPSAVFTPLICRVYPYCSVRFDSSLCVWKMLGNFVCRW